MIIDVTNKLVINYHASERIDGHKAWCEFPYPGHKDGCPNYGKTCPLPRVETYFDLSQPHWFAIVRFDLHSHVVRMSEMHPKWSDRQCRCVLYWQNKVKGRLDRLCQCWIWDRNEDLIWHKIPEAMGINVILTMKKIGQPIEIKPKIEVCKIAMIGTQKNP